MNMPNVITLFQGKEASGWLKAHPTKPTAIANIIIAINLDTFFPIILISS